MQKFGSTSPTGGNNDGGGGSETPHRLVVVKIPRRLNAPTADTMNGTMTPSPAGINCSNCSSTYATLSGTVSLNAIFNAGTTGITWGGDCAGSQITMDSDKYCYFTYTDNNPASLSTSAAIMTLRVSKTGTGGGTVTSSPAGINCISACTSTTGSVNYGGGGNSFSLTATADASSYFERWAGDCSGTAGTTSVPMNFNRHCVAIFTSGTPPL